MVSSSHTAALLSKMDMVVSVSTSSLHLCGALNIPSIALLSPYSTWQWAGGENTSTWYPEMRVVRQQKAGDWSAEINQVKQIVKANLL